MAYVQADADGTTYACSGTVLSPTAVLTARHCALDARDRQVPPESLLVVTRSTHLEPRDEGAETLHVSAVAIYPQRLPLSGDIAVLTLATPTTAPAVRLATPADTSLYANATGATVAGWGRTVPLGSGATVLQQGAVALEANADCNRVSRGFDPVTELCAASASYRTAACQGDSGGPLLVQAPDGWVQVGVASFVVDGCGTNPDFYARVSSLQPWIASRLAGTPDPPPFTPPLAAPPSVRLTVSGDHP